MIDTLDGFSACRLTRRSACGGRATEVAGVRLGASQPRKSRGETRMISPSRPCERVAGRG